MDKKQAKERIEELRKKTEYYAKAYYDDDKPKISDFEYDMLMVELRNLEKEFPEFISKDSLTQKVGGHVKEGFKKVTHEVPLQSLQDVFSMEEVEDFINKTEQKAIENNIENRNYVVETKIDGLSAALEYKEGKFVRGATRGNGLVGEDVTNNLKTLKTIPMELSEKIDITVRGEVFISKDDFEKMNQEREENEEELFANARNAAAGSLRQLDSKITASRPLDIYIFNVQKIDGKNFNSHFEELEYLSKLGFNVNPVRIECKTIKEVEEAIKKIGDEREELTFGIDGAVVKVDDLNFREILGTTIKTPRWAVAYKYPPEKKETILKDIVCQVGRTGVITPMAILEPVKVAGSTISKTTLHNEDFIKEKDLMIGDTVVIQKAGDVIPEVNKVLTEKRDGTEKVFEIPKYCPVCGEELEKEGEEVALRCTNSECPAQTYRSIIHFVSRDCMDITGMGEAIVETLIEKNLLKDITDIYKLRYEDFYELEGFKEKSSKKLIESIEKSKSNTLDKLLFGLGIRHIGKKASKILAENFEDIYKLAQASVEELSIIEDIGTIMAESICSFFKKPQTIEIIKKLDECGVNLKGNKTNKKSEILAGKTICITGSFDDYSRDDIVKMIEENSGKASSSVSKKTSYLIAGELAGSKLTKAQELGIDIISVQEFLNIIKEGNK